MPRDIPRTLHLYRTNRPARGPRGLVRFWASGEQSSPKWGIPCLGGPRIVVQNLTPLALSSAEKSVTVQTNERTNKQKTQTNSKRYIRTLPIGMCGTSMPLRRRGCPHHHILRPTVTLTSDLQNLTRSSVAASRDALN